MLRWLAVAKLSTCSISYRNPAVTAAAPAAAAHSQLSHAPLQRKEDDELLYYLLQLVQALRFEAQDNSRLARFLVNRAAHNPAFATFLHW